jgi:hypothetical protein
MMEKFGSASLGKNVGFSISQNRYYSIIYSQQKQEERERNKN